MKKIDLHKDIIKIRITKFGMKSMIWLIILLVCTIGYSLWDLRPVGDDEIKGTDAKVEREDCYLLMSGEDTLMSFQDIQGDTLFVGGKVGKPFTRVFSQPGQWVNWLPVIPSCRGRLMVAQCDTASLCHASSQTLHAILNRQHELVEKQLAGIDDQLGHTDYYIRTHNVTEGGFDMVTRASEFMHAGKDSLTAINKAMDKVKPDTPLRLVLSSKYYAWVTEGEGKEAKTTRVECETMTKRKGLILIKTLDNEVTDGVSTRLYSFHTKPIAARISQRFKTKRLLPKGMRIDSIGTYVGTVDSVGCYNGYGKLLSLDGNYYEGYWEHGERTGLGLSLSPGKRLRIGEWKNDRYLGETITYSADRIYGIDISRYQHEKTVKVKKTIWVRKRRSRKKRKKVVTVNKVLRYGIDWSNLRISGLGSLSKKTVSGDVDFKISFIYIKSTEGTTLLNAYYSNDYKAARAHGFKVGTYHFFTYRSSGASQANFFVRYSHYQKGDFPPVLDVEPTNKQVAMIGGQAAMFAHIRKWLNIVEKAYGVKPILYVSQSFVNKYLPNAPDLMKNYNIWIARYGQYRPNVNLVYWQLCPDGRVKGINGLVDINVFNGFKAEWNRFTAQ